MSGSDAMGDARWITRSFDLARQGASEGGVPVGSCLVRDGTLISEGYNRRQQDGAVIYHGEMDAIRRAGLDVRWRETLLYTSLSPCMMCAGTAVQFGIPRVVIGDATNFGGNEGFLRDRGVEVVVAENPDLVAFFRDWMTAHPDIWNGDIGA